MKYTFTLLALAGCFLISSCGPSAEQIAAKKKAMDDSIAAVQASVAAADAAKQQAMQDSMAKAQAAAVEQAKQDSIAKAAESASKKGKKK